MIPFIKKRILYAAAFFLFLPAVFPAQAQVYGCKDPAANNYNASATVNDGSCQYNTLPPFTPPVKVDPISNALTESSGLQWAGNHLWSFNDGGHDPVLFRMDTSSSAILQTVILEGATNVDWEDITFDGTHFYIGDFGNNVNGARTDLKIYKFPLSAIPDYSSHPTFTIPAAEIGVIQFTYSDQPQPPMAGSSNNTKFDCEAMLVDEGNIHLFSKNWVDATSTHYVIDGVAAGNYVATPVETLNTGYLVTAADKAPGADVVVLIGYQNSGLGLHYLHLLSDFRDGKYFNGNKRRIELRDATIMGQVEGFSFRNSTYGFISNERFERTAFGITLTVAQKLRTLNTNAFLPAYVLASDLRTFDIKKEGGKHRLSWRFSQAVKEVKLEWAPNRTNFTTLQRFDQSTGGEFLHDPAVADNCYRLSWTGDSGAKKVSRIICLNGKRNTSFSHLLLRSNGELSFNVDGNPGGDCLIRLHTTDGRLLAQTTQALFAGGVNRVRFSKSFPQHAIVLFEAVAANEKMSQLVRVE